MLRAGMVDREELDKAESTRRATERQSDRRVAPASERLSPPKRDEADQREADREASQLAGQHALKSQGRASKRWYFSARDGTLRSLDLSDELARPLEQGGAAIAESPNGKTWVVSRDGIEAIEALDPSWIRFRVM